VWKSIASVMPPLGLAWLAAVLEQDLHDVTILDAHAERLPLASIPGWIRDHGAFDMVGITATTPLINNGLEIARMIKKDSASVQVVLGGVHPTVLPDEVLSEPAVDIVVRGEGEETIRELAAGMALLEVKGISYKVDGEVVHNGDRPLIKDLDALPFPAYHLLPMGRYAPAAGAARRLPASSVLATRGCPGRCTFCYRIFGNSFRCRSGRSVAEEVALIQNRYGVKEICFYDDTFTVVKREVRAFCTAIQELKLDLTWSCFSRVDSFDEDTFGMMREVGCHQIMFGIETGNREMLKRIKKRTDPDRAEYVIRATQKLGLDVRATFMLGNPGETEETMEETIEFAIRLEPDLALFNITTPFPGTEMYKWAEENNYLRTRNWDDYDLSYPVMNLPSVSPEKVLDYYRQSHRRFMLRPKFIWKWAKRTRNMEGFKSAIRALRAVVGI